MVSSLLCYSLFHEKLNKVGGQLNSYDSADYSIIYILNYGEAFNNECLYPDTDVQIYRDADRSHRLTVSSIMREEGVSYDLGYLLPLSCLTPGEVCISENVASVYGLSIGDVLFAEYSYSSIPVSLRVASIMQTEYDYGNPFVDNNIGVVFLGFNKEYAACANGKFILFAEESKGEELAIFPQILDEVINKSGNIVSVISQGIGALAFESLFSLTAVILAHMLFFSKSSMPLYRCFLKGMNRILLSIIPLLERLIFCLLPCVVTQYMVTSGMPESLITKVFRMIPIVVCGLYSIIMLSVESLKLRRKGGRKWNS